MAEHIATAMGRGLVEVALQCAVEVGRGLLDELTRCLLHGILDVVGAEVAEAVSQVTQQGATLSG
jgi:hypothetical protein